jgi:hypothetical protein
VASIFQSWDIRRGFWGRYGGKVIAKFGNFERGFVPTMWLGKRTFLMVMGEHELFCLTSWEDRMGNFGLWRTPYYHIDV